MQSHAPPPGYELAYHDKFKIARIKVMLKRKRDAIDA